MTMLAPGGAADKARDESATITSRAAKRALFTSLDLDEPFANEHARKLESRVTRFVGHEGALDVAHRDRLVREDGAEPQHLSIELLGDGFAKLVEIGSFRDRHGARSRIGVRPRRMVPVNVTLRIHPE